ncbi:hypothetical protein [Streptomyces sp. NPDC014006]|uniref:hypothetical protein n=1 Tax=Streptomyces sp. NPDC014006 TaxID=3364870 RepID=UPI0036F96242
MTDAVAAGVRRLVLLAAHGVGRADDAHPLKPPNGPYATPVSTGPSCNPTGSHRTSASPSGIGFSEAVGRLT